ncbi:MAG: hypothetical protein IM485_15940 [Microcystis sp. M169S2]|jgi:hypothetical protein|nr:hypothetical protein [Microcystis sp. M169S2]
MNQTTANYDEPWKEALSHLENGFLQETHFLDFKTQREQWKWKLIRGLYEKEFEREQIIKLFEIIDNMMTLSNKLQSSLESKIKQFE